MTYNKTTWINKKTALSADNLNNIENGLESVYLRTSKLEEDIKNIDVTDQINAHNTSENSHQDIRNAIANIDISTQINEHNSDSNAHSSILGDTTLNTQDKTVKGAINETLNQIGVLCEDVKNALGEYATTNITDVHNLPIGKWAGSDLTNSPTVGWLYYEVSGGNNPEFKKITARSFFSNASWEKTKNNNVWSKWDSDSDKFTVLAGGNVKKASDIGVTDANNLPIGWFSGHLSHAPKDDWFAYHTFNTLDTGYKTQIAYGINNNQMYKRIFIADSYTDWRSYPGELLEEIPIGTDIIEYVKQLPPATKKSIQAPNAKNTPFGDIDTWWYFDILKHTNNSTYAVIKAYPFFQDKFFIGRIDNNVFKGWKEVATTDKIDISLLNGWTPSWGEGNKLEGYQVGNTVTVSGVIQGGNVSNDTPIAQLKPTTKQTWIIATASGGGVAVPFFISYDGTLKVCIPNIQANTPYHFNFSYFI